MKSLFELKHPVEPGPPFVQYPVQSPLGMAAIISPMITLDARDIRLHIRQANSINFRQKLYLLSIPKESGTSLCKNSTVTYKREYATSTPSL
jgi:hypothetical protein